MKNWRDYVGYQDYPTDVYNENDPAKLFILQMKDKTSTSSTVSVQVVHVPFNIVDMVMTDEEVGEKVEELLLSFPRARDYNKSMMVNNKHSPMVNQAIEEVAQKCKRGRANTNFKNAWFYKGASQFDAPIIVAGHGDKFLIHVHPHFKRYGVQING